MKRILLFSGCFLVLQACFSQSIAINATGISGDASSMLDVSSSSKGFLVPRMSTAQIASIANPAKGLLAYDSTVNQFKVNMGNATTPNWQPLASLGTVWTLGGNTGADPANSFIGTIDAVPLNFRVNNQRAGIIDSFARNTFLGYLAGSPNHNVDENVAIGYKAFSANQSGTFNVAVGSQAMPQNTEGDNNTALGGETLFHNSTGAGNTATGVFALFGNSTGNNNTANGGRVLFNNTTGRSNTATGGSAMLNNQVGNNNTANGDSALFKNYSGNYNTAMGHQALLSNYSTNYNTAVGSYALFYNSGSAAAYSSAFGAYALTNNITGNSNMAAGYKALYANSSGSSNTATGNSALYNTYSGSNNTGVGVNAFFSNATGSNNTGLGAYTDVGADFLTNATAVGYGAIVNASNKVRLGNTAVTVIEGQVPFTTPSDARFKYNIEKNVPGLAFIKKLTPVTYYFDEEKLDEYSKTGVLNNNTVHAAAYTGEKILRTGFLAQDVERAAKELGYAFDGIHAPANEKDHYSLAYSQFIMPLVKGMQEQQDMIEKQESKIAQQQNEITTLNAKLEALSKAVEQLRNK